jgi:DNA-binding NtrC family response regulator
MSDSILIVDDDKAFRIATTALLEDHGYAVEAAPSGAAAVALLEERTFDLVLSDLVMEGMNGIELLQWTTAHAAETPLIMVTGFGSINTAVEAMRLGAFDYVTKPSDNDEMLIKIRRALEARRNERELRRLREEVLRTYGIGSLVSQNERMREVFGLMRQVAATDVTVLLLGETGTGKELAARAVHYASPRRERPFIVVNCSALPETLLESELFGHERNAFTGAQQRRIGKFEEAQGGTVFLDEIGEVPLQVQTKLLRVLQEREIQRVGGNDTIAVDVRVIAATNRNLEDMIAGHAFRADLFYRLNEFPVTLPPLRERPDDLPLLVAHFLDKHARLSDGRVRGVAPRVLERMARHPWNGNVRELENLVKRAIILTPGDTITDIDIPNSDSPAGTADGIATRLPAAPDPGTPFKEYMKSLVANAESAYLRSMLHAHHGNISAVAELMDVDRKTVYRKMEEYGIAAEKFR